MKTIFDSMCIGILLLCIFIGIHVIKITRAGLDIDIPSKLQIDKQSVKETILSRDS